MVFHTRPGAAAPAGKEAAAPKEVDEDGDAHSTICVLADCCRWSDVRRIEKVGVADKDSVRTIQNMAGQEAPAHKEAEAAVEAGRAEMQ